MQILLNNSNTITAFAINGSFDGGIEISEEMIPNGFYKKFKSNYFMYENDEIKLNPNYIERPHTPQPKNLQIPGSDDELRQMFANMQVQMVQGNMMAIQLSKQNASLSQEVVRLNQEIENLKGGTE
jgi:hypothetical protein